MSEIIEIYIDGACSGNPGPGGWGVLIIKGGLGFEFGGGEENTTNNIMEMTAAIEALVEVAEEECPIKIFTDSEYLKKGITQWIHLWKVKGWRKANGGEIQNLDLWQELDDLNRPEIQWEWVKAHSLNPYNNRVDKIARSFSLNKPVNLFKGEELKVILGEISPKKTEVKITTAEKKELIIHVCLPFIEKFAQTLEKKSFKSSFKDKDNLKYSFSKGGTVIKVYNSGAFEFGGVVDDEIEELAASIADADDRFLEKFIGKMPLDFPEDLSLWTHEHLKVLLRPFFKKMVTKWKFIPKEEFIAIWDPLNSVINFEINIKEEYSWKTLPPPPEYARIREQAYKSLIFEDRFTLSLAGDERYSFAAVLLPADRTNLNLAISRNWEAVENDFNRIDGREKFRIKKQLKNYTSSLSWHVFKVFDSTEEEKIEKGEIYVKITAWMNEKLKSFLNQRNINIGRFPLDVIMKHEKIKEEMLVFMKEKNLDFIIPVLPGDKLENSLLFLCNFIANLIQKSRF